jgi:hypothetical protein
MYLDPEPNQVWEHVGSGLTARVTDRVYDAVSNAISGLICVCLETGTRFQVPYDSAWHSEMVIVCNDASAQASDDALMGTRGLASTRDIGQLMPPILYTSGHSYTWDSNANDWRRRR